MRKQAINRRISIVWLSLIACTGCQSVPNSEDVMTLEELNARPEQLPMWNESRLTEPASKLLSTASSFSRTPLSWLARKKNNEDKPAQVKPTPSITPRALTAKTQPKATPKATPKASTKKKPKTTTRPKPKVTPKVKTPQKTAAPVTNSAPAEKPTSPTNESPEPSTRDDILRGKSIQESPLGPRQPIELQ